MLGETAPHHFLSDPTTKGTPLDPTRDSEGSFAMGSQFADPKDNIVMNLSKAQRLLGEVTTRQNM